LLSTRWGQPADVVVSRQFERSLRPLLDLGRRAHSALTGVAYAGPFYTVQVTPDIDTQLLTSLGRRRASV